MSSGDTPRDKSLASETMAVNGNDCNDQTLKESDTDNDSFEELLVEGSKEKESDADDLLEELAEGFGSDDKCGEPIYEKLAKVANDGMRTKLYNEKIKEISEKELIVQPDKNEEFKVLCSNDHPETDNLFSDDLRSGRGHRERKQTVDRGACNYKTDDRLVNCILLSNSSTENRSVNRQSCLKNYVELCITMHQLLHQK
uniref:Uncharacterized protein n=1 Tax=Magallana gigas TaxID=29159 RepID=A0A8W8KQN7_MAGGI